MQIVCDKSVLGNFQQRLIGSPSSASVPYVIFVYDDKAPLI